MVSKRYSGIIKVKSDGFREKRKTKLLKLETKTVSQIRESNMQQATFVMILGLKSASIL